VLFDLLSYWVHRLLHTVPYFWRFHAVHHSSRDLDWLATSRDHPLDFTAAVLPAVFLVVAGSPLARPA
jgi:sterol desaturase/sphingolipid hydroxylase (fatty acid hydroxylase superfamily)